jgi:endonuclease III
MAADTGARAHRVAQLLGGVYRSPRHNNKSNPVDELVFILLSQMTTRNAYERVYDGLKKAFPRWESARMVSLCKLRSVIKSAGLARQKSIWIKAILNRIYEDFGGITLDALRERHTACAQKYLMGLPGVNLKTAKCVLLYSFGRDVLPVDTHVLRVSRRLGLLPDTAPLKRAHDYLESLVRPADRYEFHVNVLAHGRAVCRARFPLCEKCILRRVCRAYRSGSVPGE